MKLTKQVICHDQFLSWFDAGEKQIIDDARSAYRMELPDAAVRDELGLSQLPSTKSVEYVDHFVDTALPLYHQSREAITFQAQAADASKDHLARLLTEIFRLRSKPQYFDFFNWHSQALTAVATDGIVCAMVSWLKETKKKKVKQYLITDDMGNSIPVPKEAYDASSGMLPPGYTASVKDVENEIVVKDTWNIDLLEPGKDIIWDVKIPNLDVNKGQFCIVKLRKSAQWALNKSEQGVFKKLKLDDIKNYLKAGLDTNHDNSQTTPDPDYVDQGEYNNAEIWVAFENVNNEWLVSFSIEGKFELSGDKPVNDVFFNGREVNRLPVVIGAIKMKLWESLGRGIPETIKPIEKEYIDHINNFNDLVKQISQGGRARFSPGTDLDEEQVLRARAFYAEKDDVEFMPVQQGVLESLRGADFTNSKINSLVPTTTGGVGRDVVPKGAGDNTLGALQLTQQTADGKMAVNLLTYNNTFFIPIMWLIAQNEFAYETDEMLTRIAAKKANVQPPMQGYSIDFRQLDFDVDIQILAGLGSVPTAQKGQALIQFGQLCQTLGINYDKIKLVSELSEINGYDADAFKPQLPGMPPPPPPDYKMNITMDLIQLLGLAPAAGQFLLQKMMSGGVDVTAKVDGKNPQTQKLLNEAKQNGGGYMAADRTGTIVDGNSQAALGMSQGGMQNAGQ